MSKPKDLYKSFKKEIVNCPVCENDKYDVLHHNDRYYMGVQTVICKKCSLIYINPRPTEEEISNFYRFHYRKFYESIDVPNDEYIKNGPYIPRANFVIDTLQPYLKESSSFLDIGCAEGTLLKLVEEKFNDIKTVGIEPSESFGNYANSNLKANVFIGTYQEYLKENNSAKFDVITTTHVLEHILDPKSYLRGIGSFMHEESVLYIEVPNIMDKNAKGIGNIHLGHVLYLDPLTIRLLLEECGFEIINIYTENLPALTPSMSVVCRKKKSVSKASYPSRKYRLKKINSFRENVLGKPKLKTGPKNYILSLIKRIKARIKKISSK